MSLMTANNMSWNYLPLEIRTLVLEVLLQDGCTVASLATVSREWQTIIERHNFSRIHLTPARLADFGSMLYRNRALVHYIWLCLELQEYNCALCAPEGDDRGFSNTDNALVTTVLQNLFSTLSAWDPHGNLLLDISVYSPSDSEHWFKYLTFRPDVPSNECGQGQYAEQPILAKVNDQRHGWINSTRVSMPDHYAIDKVFDQIMDVGPFDTDEQEDQWWQQLPLVPAITGVLLRQQTRRRWKPKALAQMFSRLPRLQEIHYEPWMEWCDSLQVLTDRYFQSLFESLASSRQLRRLILFENFNQQYPLKFLPLGCDSIRIPSSNVSRAVANSSFQLEHLSASFILEASYFFRACEPSWEWPNLTLLTITSQLLAPNTSQAEIDNMLQAAAAAAMKMPNIKTIEIWNGRKGFAIAFIYQSTRGGQPTIITWRGTRKFALRPPVIRDWETVALKHHSHGLVIVKEILDSAVIKSHGDAIHHLKLSSPVIRPVSLWQIRTEHRICENLMQ